MIYFFPWGGRVRGDQVFVFKYMEYGTKYEYIAMYE